jgi:hypothetical protein
VTSGWHWTDPPLVRKRVLGPEHRRPWATRSNLARVTPGRRGSGRLRDQFADLLALCDGSSARERPDTLAAQANLSCWTRRANGNAWSGVSSFRESAGIPAVLGLDQGREQDPRLVSAKSTFWVNPQLRPRLGGIVPPPWLGVKQLRSLG